MSSIGPEGRKQLQLTAEFAAAGLVLVVAITVGYFGGRALDRWLGTDPYCGYAGLVLGIVAGFRNLFQLAARAKDGTSKNASTKPASDLTPPESSDP
jgi:ATP synthase protein I